MTNFFKKEFFQSFCSKLFIASIYLGVIIFFLYLPKLRDLIFVPSKVIHVYGFTDMISSDCIKEFEKKTGIAVKLKYFDTNDELLANFKINKGKGYDLITASDFAIDILCKEELLSKINTSRLLNFKHLDNRFLNRYFDYQNQYSVPYFWSTFGILFNRNVFEKTLIDLNMDMSWDFVFKDRTSLLPNIDYKICVLDTPRDSIFLTARHLFRKTDNLRDDET